MPALEVVSESDWPCPVCTSTAPARHRYTIQGYRVMLCAVCGAEFLLPRPALQEIESLYTGRDYYANASGVTGYPDYAGEADAIRATSRRRLSLLRPFLSTANRPRMLEMGAAYGYFLDVAREDGLDTVGLDISAAAVDEMSRRGHQALCGDLRTHRFSSSFDALVLFDTIEHIYNLPEFVTDAARALRPGGVLAFTTPDTHSLSARLSGKRWISYRPPEHLVYLNPPSVTILLAPHFTVLHSEPDRQYVSVAKLLSQLTWGRSRLGRLASAVRRHRLSQMRLPVPNGMRFYIARRHSY